MWFHVLIFSLIYSFANAQSSTGSDASQDGLYANFDPSMAIVIAVLVLAFFSVGIFSFILRHCTESGDGAGNSVIHNAAAGGQTRRRGLESAVIEKFPIFVYFAVKDIKIGRAALECAVCLSEFEDDETLRLLPKCNHVFHSECIDTWLSSHVTCPVCRANLTPESRATTKHAPHQQSATESIDQESNASESSEIQDDVAIITVSEEQSRDPPVTVTATKNQPPRSGISGKFPRSHSTGHSLVQPGENVERYTLRLPEEVRRQIMESSKARLQRTRSFNVVLAGEGSWSSRKGYRSGGEDGSSRGKQIARSDRWVFLKAPSFVSKAGSVKSSKVVNDGDSSHSKTLLASVKIPLNCLSRKGDDMDLHTYSGQLRLPV